MPNKVHRLIDKLDAIFDGTPSGVLVAENEINFDLLSEVIDDCFLVKIQDDLFRYSYLGRNIIKAFGDSFFSADINSLVLPSNHIVADKFKTVITTKKSLVDEGVFKNSDGIEIKYRQKIYPLTDESGGSEVKLIFGGMRWKSEV